MVATAIYSVTMVLWKETTFPHYYYYYFIPQVVKIPGVKNYKSELWDAEMQVSIIIITIIKYDSQQYEGDF